MLQDPVVATVIILALLTLGEVVSIATRARIPMLLVSLMCYFLLLRTGVIPGDLLDNSTFVTVGTVLGTAPILVHMGTLIPTKIIKSQWRAVIISLIGILISSIMILLLVTLVFDYQTAVSGTGPLTGGIIAFLITTATCIEAS